MSMIPRAIVQRRSVSRSNIKNREHCNTSYKMTDKITFQINQIERDGVWEIV